jgi:hypothetical protein
MHKIRKPKNPHRNMEGWSRRLGSFLVAFDLIDLHSKMIDITTNNVYE